MFPYVALPLKVASDSLLSLAGSKQSARELDIADTTLIARGAAASAFVAVAAPDRRIETLVAELFAVQLPGLSYMSKAAQFQGSEQ
jgi:hypothetical protein